MTASNEAVRLAQIAARAAADKLAEQIIALDVSERLVLTDAFVLASASNERQIKSIVDAIEERLHEAGVDALRREGLTELRWVLLDFGEIVVHVQHTEDRVYYALERLWKDCPEIEVPTE